ncbi:MAG: DnaA regulatory inactivator Hda [Acidiferrobacter sp.]
MRQLPLDLRIRDKPSFQNFWPGENAAALQASQALAVGGRGPLYLFGPGGCGKTHLLAAAAQAASEEGVCAYLALTQASEAQWEGLADIPSTALLCIDELDAVRTRPDWEHRLFVLIETLTPMRRILFAGRTNPAGLGIMRDDLRTRLASGPVLAMAALSDEAKAQALRHRALTRGLSLSAASAAYLLAHGPRDPRALFVLLEQLDQATLADGRRLTIPYLRVMLERLS